MNLWSLVSFNVAEGTKTIDWDEQTDKLSEFSKGNTPKLFSK